MMKVITFFGKVWETHFSRKINNYFRSTNIFSLKGKDSNLKVSWGLFITNVQKYWIFKNLLLFWLKSIDAHRGGWGGIKVYPPSKIFAKLVNKNAIKHQKGVPSPKNFHNPYIPSLPKFVKNLPDPPPRISNRVHLCWKGTIFSSLSLT